MPDPDVLRCAAQLAARLPETSGSFDDVRREVDDAYLALLHAVRRTHERFGFDRDGHACEVAAVEEALYQFALALARGRK